MGGLISRSQRVEPLKILEIELGLSEKSYWWNLDPQRHISVKSVA